MLTRLIIALVLVSRDDHYRQCFGVIVDVTRCPECGTLFGGISSVAVTTALVKHLEDEHGIAVHSNATIDKCAECPSSNANFCLRCGLCWTCSSCEHTPKEYVTV